MTKQMRHRPGDRGFTLIEVLVVVGIIGILMAVGYPSILNTLAVRNLENTTRQIQSYLQQTKLRAVDTKIVHRVRFYLADGGYWVYEMERFQADGTWARVEGPPRKTISRGTTSRSPCRRPDRTTSPSSPRSGPWPTSPSTRTPSSSRAPSCSRGARWTSGSSACSWADRSNMTSERAPEMNTPKHERGFSLMEALVGIFLVGVAVIGLAQIFLVAITNNLRADRIANATFLAQQQIDWLRGFTLDELTAYAGTTLEARDEIMDLNVDGKSDYRRVTRLHRGPGHLPGPGPRLFGRERQRRRHGRADRGHGPIPAPGHDVDAHHAMKEQEP